MFHAGLTGVGHDLDIASVYGLLLPPFCYTLLRLGLLGAPHSLAAQSAYVAAVAILYWLAKAKLEGFTGSATSLVAILIAATFASFGAWFLLGSPVEASVGERAAAAEEDAEDAARLTVAAALLRKAAVALRRRRDDAAARGRWSVSGSSSGGDSSDGGGGDGDGNGDDGSRDSPGAASAPVKESWGETLEWEEEGARGANPPAGRHRRRGAAGGAADADAGDALPLLDDAVLSKWLVEVQWDVEESEDDSPPSDGAGATSGGGTIGTATKPGSDFSLPLPPRPPARRSAAASKVVKAAWGAWCARRRSPQGLRLPVFYASLASIATAYGCRALDVAKTGCDPTGPFQARYTALLSSFLFSNIDLFSTPLFP